jgi:hypothetical protein
MIGNRYFHQFQGYVQWLLGSLSILSVVSIFYSLLFYIAILPYWLIVPILILLSTFWEIRLKRSFDIPTEWKLPSWTIDKWTILYLGSMIAYFGILIWKATDAAIYSPWLILPGFIIPLFIFATLVLIKIIYKNEDKSSLMLLTIHSFGLIGLAFIVYKLGFGYDPFLHQAGINNIISTGTLTPKPLFYIGEYSLIIFLRQLTLLPVEFINRLLLPLLFCLTVPTILFHSLKRSTDWSVKNIQLLMLSLFFIPVTLFINTTPLGLAGLIAVLIIFLSLTNKDTLPKWFLPGLAILAAFAHPLFGIPLILYAALPFIDNIKSNPLKKIAKITDYILTALAIPLLFCLYAIVNHQPISFSLRWPLSMTWQSAHQYNFLFDLLYSLNFNYLSVFMLILGVSIFFAWQNRKTFTFISPLIFCLCLLGSYFLGQILLNLDFVTSKNQSDFLNRALDLTYLFSLPVIFVFFNHLYNAQKRSHTWKIFTILIIVMIVGFRLYATYPVKDNYNFSHLINVSATDFNTVQLIHDQNRTNFIVLANQNLAAAAIASYGFSNYYGSNFYYSVPSGSTDNLYPLFEEMMAKPSREIMVKAMDIAGVNQAFFIVNDYWTGANKTIAAARTQADSWFPVDDGKNIIFFYKK